MNIMIRDLVFKTINKIVQIGMVLIVCSATGVSQDRMAAFEKGSMVYNGVPITQDADKSEVLNKIISITIQDAPLLEAVEKIAVKANLEMVYNSKLLEKKNLSITTRLEQVTVEKALWALLEGTGLRFAVSANKQLVLLERKRMNNSPQWPTGVSQETITGTVTDGQSGETLPGVNILVKGTSTGASTDANGVFKLTVESLQDTLVVTYIGYQRQEVLINGRTEIDIAMQPQAIAGEEMVVIGYGSAQKEDLTGSVGIVDIENMEGISITAPEDALQGQVPGVSITKATGMPGAGSRVQIRGHSNIGAGGQPLYVVDGFALPQPQDEAEARLRNPMTDINPSDIASMTVLKGPSATAIYGSRASNGVIVIETKEGHAGIPRVDISASTGLQTVLDMEPALANARQYVEFENYIWQNRVNNGQAEEVPEMFRNPEQYNEDSGTDWVNLMRRNYAPEHKVQASVSGGSESFRSYFSGGIRHQEGVIKNTSFTRLNLRANMDTDLSEKLQVGLNFAPSYTLRSLPNQQEARGGSYAVALRTCPLSPAYDEEGNLLPFPSLTINNGNGCPGALRMPNALYGLEVIDNNFTGLRLLSTAFLDYTFVKGLSIRTNINVNWNESEENYFSPSTLGSRNTPPPVLPIGRVSSSRDLTWLSETTLNWITELGPGNLNALTGFSAERGNNFASTFSGDFPNDEIRTLNVASNLNGSHTEQGWSLLSILGRVNYNLLNRYLFTGSIRADGSSRFGSNNRWGMFPSGAFAWNIHNELFMKSLNAIDQLKLRVSYGFTGNNQISNYAALGTVQTDDYLFGESTAGGSRLVSLANSRLSWEKMEEWNVGVDVALFNNQLQITADAYSRKTSNLLLPKLLPRTSGFRSITANQGTLQNSGIELAMTTHNVSTNNFTWTTIFNWTLNRNKVVSLPDGEPIFSGSAEGQPTHITEEGQPVGMMIGYEIEGIYSSQEEIDNNPSFEGAIPGNLRWKDTNGDGEITPGPIQRGGDFNVIGDPHPDFTFSLTNNLSFGPFEARILITGRKGGDIAQIAHFRENRNLDGQLTPAADYVKNFWRSIENPGDGMTPTPLGSAEARRRYRGMHSDVIADGSNIWLRNAMLRYNLPERLVGMRGASVYLSVHNPYIITSYPGNPDVQMSSSAGGLQLGMDNFSYPIARQYTIGVQLSL